LSVELETLREREGKYKKMRKTDLKCLKRVVMVELHPVLSLDMTYTLPFAVVDSVWIFNCGIDLRLKFHQNIHDHLNTVPTYHTDRIIIGTMMQRARCIAGRATTFWKAHREGHPEMPLVIKDSWQYSERDEEGDLLCEATRKGVVTVARYYHHEAVTVRGIYDDIRKKHSTG
jgi:hypothetical protein